VKVGDIVKLKVRSPLWDRREAYAYPIAQFEVYTGTVLPSPSWVGADELCLATGEVRFPFRVIEKARIEGYSQGPVLSKALERSWTVPGSKPGQSYLVTREGARWSCNCVGFGYRRACNHVVIAKAKFEGVSNSLESKEEKKVVKSENTPCVLIQQGVYLKSRMMNRGASASKVKGNLNMTTQVGLAVEIYTRNPSIGHEAFVAEFLKVFPAQTPKIAALYWQNRPRRASFGLPPIALPAIYKDATSAKAPKPAKAPKVAKDIHAASNKLIGSFVAREAKAKAKLEKSVRSINSAHKAKVELNVDEIAKIKEANLERMREVSERLKPKGKVRDYGTRVAAPEGDGVSDFDPSLAREEVNAILRDERLIDVCPKFVREDA
jgi:hypothetical protein